MKFWNIISKYFLYRWLFDRLFKSHYHPTNNNFNSDNYDMESDYDAIGDSYRRENFRVNSCDDYDFLEDYGLHDGYDDCDHYDDYGDYDDF